MGFRLMGFKPQVFLFSVFCAVATAGPETAAIKKSTGVQQPGVQIQAEKLVAEKEFAWAPSWLLFAKGLMGPGADGQTLTVIDGKSLEMGDPETGFDDPCAGAITAFKSLWVMNCGTGEIIRLNPNAEEEAKAGTSKEDAEAKTEAADVGKGNAAEGKGAEGAEAAVVPEAVDRIQAKIPVGAGKTTWGIAATDDSIWALTDGKTTLSRIDPAGNRVVGELRVPAGCNQLLAAANALWVTCPDRDEVLRVSPVLNIVEKRIDVAKRPSSMVFAGGALWVLGLTDGKIDKIDPKENKVTETIDLKSYNNASGSLAFGDGSLWASVPGFPLTRIDPEVTTDDGKKAEVLQQFVGKGGGAIHFGAGALWMVNPGDGTMWKIDPKRILATVAD